MVVFNVIRVHIVYVTIKVGVAKHSWTSWPRPLPLCPYKAFSKVGDYALAVGSGKRMTEYPIFNLLTS